MPCAPGNNASSSEGWNTSLTVPCNSSLIDCNTAAAPSKIDICPSCPQACITPSFCDAKGNPVSSWIGNASISARNAITGPV